MIKVEKNEKGLMVECSKATRHELVLEAASVVASVVETLYAEAQKDGKVDAKEIAEITFTDIIGLASNHIKNKAGVDVLDIDGDDDEEESTFVKAVPIDSEEGRKLMELLGINKPEETLDDDETEDDLPKFLF